jgi:hypothetical protein
VTKHDEIYIFYNMFTFSGRLCGLVVRVLDYRSGGPDSIPGTTRFSGGGKKKEKEEK